MLHLLKEISESRIHNMVLSINEQNVEIGIRIFLFYSAGFHKTLSNRRTHDRLRQVSDAEARTDIE